MCVTVLERLSLAIRFRSEIINLEVIGDTRIPIIKFVHKPTSHYYDITCNKLGVHNSKLLRSLIAVDPSLFRPFFFFIKLWANSHGLIDSRYGGFCSYALNILALFYFQQLKLLPSVKELQKNVPVELCHFWNVNFSAPKPLDHTFKRPKFLHLLNGFFQFYKSLDSANYVISPFIGQLIPADDFYAPLHKIHKSMPLYTENLFARKLPSLKIGQFNIQELFELNRNVTSGFIYEERFKSLCRDAEQICLQITPNSPISSLLGNFAIKSTV